ncbi:DUF5133 domain-containing protein [Streptomyces sp. NPDC050147]|uniref:DUF5133 domain-containing protein n=1 Tax=Streptomyces sp. NPDC050147 TaxID=3155513 RepID=UPI0034256A58
MLMADPRVLRDLVEQYDALSALHARNGAVEARKRLEDIAYTLCVSTGTRDVRSALLAARAQMTMAEGEPEAPQPV